MVSFKERKRLIWDSLFYWVKEILVKGLLHEQGYYFLFASYPEISITSK